MSSNTKHFSSKFFNDVVFHKTHRQQLGADLLNQSIFSSYSLTQLKKKRKKLVLVQNLKIHWTLYSGKELLEIIETKSIQSKHLK